MKRIILMTGGGSAGHVTPNIALMPQLRKEGYELHYAGTEEGIERRLVEEQEDVTYHVISSGKLRRYFSLKNFTDPFRVVKGVFQSRKLVRQLKPDVVFSKGGFVSVPVVMGAKGKAPIVVHESDYTPGLANRIAIHYADRVCVTFEDTLPRIKKGKGVHTGTPVRRELFAGKADQGLALAGFDGKKPVLLVMGGSLGAQAVNDVVRAALEELTQRYDIVHLCGRGKVDPAYDRQGYRQFEYLGPELPDVMAAADLVLSRAGANAVFEFLALCKPAVLVPLPLSASRGDQILNAQYFQRKGYAILLEQEKLTPQSLVDTLQELCDNRLGMIAAMAADPLADGTDEVLDVIRSVAQAREDCHE